MGGPEAKLALLTKCPAKIDYVSILMTGSTISTAVPQEEGMLSISMGIALAVRIHRMLVLSRKASEEILFPGFASVLELRGFEVVQARDGAQALQLLSSFP